MRILWFGDFGRRNSFSRISENVLLQFSLKQEVKVYALFPPREMVKDRDKVSMFHLEKVHYVGDPIQGSNDTMTLKEVLRILNRTNPNKPDDKHVKIYVMKYTLISMCHFIDLYKIDCMVMVGGDIVMEWFMKHITEQRNSFPCKVVVWTPWDYVPNPKSIQYTLCADKVFTMNPIVIEKFQRMHQPRKEIRFLGHGISDCFFRTMKNDAFRSVHKAFPYLHNLCAKDIVFLNANDCIHRKQLDLTLKAYEKFFRKRKSGKLWIHTNKKCDLYWQVIEPYQKLIRLGKIITTHNEVSDEVLNSIYNVCQIGIQTSWGEGWSLTSIEHQQTGAIQVVPNFLATKYHFEHTENILYNVEEVCSVDERGNSVIIGIGKVDDIVHAMDQAYTFVKSKRVLTVPTRSLTLTWKEVSSQLTNELHTLITTKASTTTTITNGLST